MNEEIKKYYGELRGYLKNAPVATDACRGTSDQNFWQQYNKTVSQLSEVSGNDYSRFLIEPQNSPWSVSNDGNISYAPFVVYEAYRQKLGGLIGYLHQQYFSGEPDPLSDKSGTIINQTQLQSQFVNIEIFLTTIQSKIDERLRNAIDGSNEKTFLQKLKESLPTIKDATQILSQSAMLAKTYGLSLDDLFRIFR